MLPGTAASEAYWINEHSQIIGQLFSCDFSVVKNFLWEKGTMLDLSSLVRSDSSLRVALVYDINDRGEIVGIGTLPNGQARAILLIPHDDPQYAHVPESAEDITRPGAAIVRRPTPMEIATVKALVGRRRAVLMPFSRR